MSVILFSIFFAGCQISDSARQHPAGSEIRQQNNLPSYSASERLTYRQYAPPPQNSGRPLPQIGGLLGFLNPFKPQSKQVDHSRFSVSDTAIVQPRDQRSPTQPHDQGNDALLPAALTRDGDPPDIVAFAAILNETDYFAPEQKAEIIALLRQESPTMRSCIMANHLSAIRNGSTGQRSADSVSNPIVQVSHASLVSGSSLNEPPIRLSNYSNTRGNEVRTADWPMSQDASNPMRDSQGEIRQVADQSMRTNVEFRTNMPQIEPGVVPQISTDTTLPTVAGLNDFTSSPHPDSSVTTTDAPVPPLMTNIIIDSQREASPSRQPLAPVAPVIGSREIIPNQMPGTRLASRDMGLYRTKINFVDYDTRIPRTMRSLSNRENEEEDISHDTAESGDFVNNISQGGNSVRMAVQSGRDEDGAEPLHNVSVTRQFQNATPTFPRESWDDTVRQALNLLNMQVSASESLNDKEQLQDEINLRLLNLTLGNQREAIRLIDGLPMELQEFWRNTLFGLSTMLDDVSDTDESSRIDRAHQYLQRATLSLQNLCPVRMRNQCFINQCDGFGVYEKSSPDFRRGEPIFIYAEIENLTCRESEEGYHIQVNSSYEIVDIFGNKVANGEFSQTGKNTQSRIRDVFLLWRVDLPENIMPGKYFIRLYVVDTNHPNYLFDQASLELSVLSPLGNR